MMLCIGTFAYLLLALMTTVTGCIQAEKDYAVYYGWPFTIESKTAFNYFEFLSNSRSPKRVSPLTGIIIDRESDLILLNVTQKISMLYFRDHASDMYEYRIENVTHAISSHYQIILKQGGFCKKLNVTLRKMKLSGDSCEADLNRRPRPKTKVVFGRNFLLRCDAVTDDLEVPANLISSEEYSRLGVRFRWRFNCGEALPQNSETSHNSSLLSVHRANYSTNAGTYTCEVEYNGMTRYRIHYEVCLTPSPTRILTANCNNPKGKLNGDVSVTCNIDAGVSASQDFGLHGFFHKLQENLVGGSVEEYWCHDLAKQPNDSRITCELQRERTEVNGPRCFRENPTEKELRSQATHFTFMYKIRNLTNSDFGDFFMTFSRDNRDNVKVNFTISEDREEEFYQTQRILIGISLVFGVPLFTSIMIWSFAGIEIRWIWHKLCIPHEEENKKYVAYLTYHYNKDMTETIPSHMESLLNRLHSRFQSSGARIFDSCRDSSIHTYKAESVSKTLEDCHRVIILLTPEYVKDQWGVYEAYKAWKAVIENAGIKIIFILFPTTKITINKLPRDLKTALQQALKRHNVIHWNGKTPISKRLWMQLDTLMPKLIPHQSMKLGDLSKLTCDGKNQDE